VIFHPKPCLENYKDWSLKIFIPLPAAYLQPVFVRAEMRAQASLEGR
jgi:hypothetical protein